MKLLERTWMLEDESGEYEVYLIIEKRFTWKDGFFYVGKVSDFSCADKKLLEVVSMIVEHLYRDSPAYYRLKERCRKP